MAFPDLRDQVNHVPHPTSQVGKVGLPPLRGPTVSAGTYTTYPNEERGQAYLPKLEVIRVACYLVGADEVAVASSVVILTLRQARQTTTRTVVPAR